MTSTKRRINSTGRRRIMRECVDIRLQPNATEHEPPVASANFRLGDLGFPPNAKVILEAYQRSSGMRFECGTIDNLNVPPLLRLNEIDNGGSILFRLKIVDADAATSRILGSADRLRPTSSDDLEGRRSIFPISERLLGDEVWRVELDEAGPVLLLNCRILGFKHRILEDPLVQGIIVPAAFRIVLERLVADPIPDDNDDADWRTLWLRYLKEQFSIDDSLTDLNSDEQHEWVEATIRTFCQAHGFVQNIRAMTKAAE